jgi:transcriptional regulator with XRE-family HTH domain
MPRRNSRDPKTSPKARLGEELAKARENAGFATQAALAEELRTDRTVIGKAESGERPPSEPVLKAWIETCHIENVELIDTLAELARASDGPIPAWFEDFLQAEREAHTLRFWQPLIVPGPLQTADYARVLFSKARVDPAKIDGMVTARLERQKVFERADAPHTVVVLDEGVLHHLIGTPAIMHDQLMHLARLAETLQVQVVPSSRGGNAGLSGGFTIASIDGAPDVLRMEAVEDVTEERRHLVRRAALVFDLVRGDALPCEESRTVIAEAAEQWKARLRRPGASRATAATVVVIAWRSAALAMPWPYGIPRTATA